MKSNFAQSQVSINEPPVDSWCRHGTLPVGSGRSLPASYWLVERSVLPFPVAEGFANAVVTNAALTSKYQSAAHNIFFQRHQFPFAVWWISHSRQLNRGLFKVLKSSDVNCTGQITSNQCERSPETCILVHIYSHKRALVALLTEFHRLHVCFDSCSPSLVLCSVREGDAIPLEDVHGRSYGSFRQTLCNSFLLHTTGWCTGLFERGSAGAETFAHRYFSQWTHLLLHWTEDTDPAFAQWL